MPWGRRILAVHVDEQQVGTHRQYDRTFHPVCLLGALHPPHMASTFELFYREFHAPPHGIGAENRARTDIQEIGHDDLDALRPRVSPFFREHARDIAELMPHSVTQKAPLSLPCAIRLVGGATTLGAWGKYGTQSRPYWPCVNLRVRGSAKP